MRRLRRVLAAGWAEPFTRWLGIVLVVATAVRVVWVLYAAHEPAGPIPHDPDYYLLAATRIAGGDGYTLPTGDPTAYYPVGYPAALAVVVWLVSHTPLPDNVPVAAGMLNVGFAVATVALIGVVAKRLTGWRVGVLAAGLAAVFPNQIYYTATMLSETLFNLLLVASLAILVWRRGDPGWHRVLAGGLVLGLAVLTRPVALLVVPFAALAWWLARSDWRTALRRMLVLALGVVVVVAPWTIRNWVRLGEPVVISTNTGDNLCIGHNPEATGGFQFTDACIVAVPDRASTEAELARNEELTARAIEFVVEHPERQIPLLWWRAFYTYRTDDDGLGAVQSYGDDPFLGSRTEDVLSTIANAFYFGLLALAVLGVVGLWSRRDPRKLLFLGWALAMAIAPLAFFGDARFKVPFALLCVVPAAVTLAALADIRRARLDADRAGDVTPAG